MPRTCAVTGKKSSPGKSYAIRGIAKKLKGIGLKVTGIKRRRFKPNIQKKRVWLAEENRFIRINVTPSGLKTIDRKGVDAVVREMRARGQKV